MHTTLAYTVRRIQEHDGSWRYCGIVRDTATSLTLWAGHVTANGAAADRAAFCELVRRLVDAGGWALARQIPSVWDRVRSDRAASARWVDENIDTTT